MTRKRYIIQIMLAIALSLTVTILLVIPAMGNSLAVDELQYNDPYRVESFNIDGPGDLDVQTSGGFITVEGSSSNTMRVEMYVRKDGQNLSPEDVDLEDWDISLTQSGNTVEVIAERANGNRGSWGNNNISVSFVIHSPQEMSSKLNTSGGHIETRNLKGSQQISTSGGHIELDSLEGNIEARTSGGHINISNIQGETRAKTSGGHINAHNVEGNLEVKTSGGHIQLASVSGSIEAATSGGGIDADLNTIGPHVNLRTSGGNVSVTIPENIGLNLKLRGSYVNTSLDNFSGEVEHNEVKGELHGGGPEISARTSGGTVSLSFQ